MGNWLRAARLLPCGQSPGAAGLSHHSREAQGRSWSPARGRGFRWEGVGGGSWPQACFLPYLCSLESTLESQPVAVTLAWLFSSRKSCHPAIPTLWVLVKECVLNFRQKEPPRDICLAAPPPCPTLLKSLHSYVLSVFFKSPHLPFYFHEFVSEGNLSLPEMDNQYLCHE